MISSRLKAIVFDFDGVIVESVDIKEKAFYELYNPFGKEVADEVARQNDQMGGQSRFVKLRKWHLELLGKALSESELSELANQYGQLVEAAVSRAPLVAGVKEFLSSHSTVVPMHVASATPEEELKRIVVRLGLTQHFVAVHGYPTRKDKVLSSIKSELGLVTDEICMIGDTMTDYEAAASADVRFFGRKASGNIPFPAGTHVFTDFFELPALLGFKP